LYRRYPVTSGLTAVVWLLAVLSGDITTGPGPALADVVGLKFGAITAGLPLQALTSLLWCAGPGPYLVTTALIVLVVPWSETVLGSARALAVLLTSQLVGSVVLAGCLAALGSDGPAGEQVVLGPSGAVLGLALAASAAISRLWRHRLRLILIVGLVTLAVYSASTADLARLAIGTTGLALGTTGMALGAARWRTTDTNDRLSPPQLRLLLALVVTASAVGPLVAAWSHSHVGPLSVLRYVFASPPPDATTVAGLCAGGVPAAVCAHLQARLRLSGIGPAVMSALPVALLLACSHGLRLGRRAAWLAAVVLNCVLAVLGLGLAVATATSPPAQRLILGPGPEIHSWLLFCLPLLQPVAVAAVLVACRRLFEIRAPHGTYRAWSTRVAATLGAVLAVYVVGSALVPCDYQPRPSLSQIVADAPTRLIPPGYLGAFEPAFLPTTPLTTVLYEWSGIVFWAVVVAAALGTFARSRFPTDERGDRVRELLASGGGSLSYPVTWPGNAYWFTPDRTDAVAYRVFHGVAITTGDPIGDRADLAEVIAGFQRFCQDQGWIPCWYAVSAPTAAVAQQRGWRTLQVGEEASLDPETATFTGRRWQNVRTAINHAARAGITAEWWRFGEAPTELTDQIRTLSQEWVAAKGLPEMGFTLGGLAELADDDVRLLLAVDQRRTVQAVTSWLPVRRDGVLIGYTLDLMRRRATAFNGVMEFLIATAVTDARQQNLKFLSLSGAPLARHDRGQPASRSQRLLDVLAAALEPVYGFASLLAFKARFQPTYHPLYLAYPDPVALPKIARAILRAYLPRITLRQSAAVTLRLIQRHRSRTGRGSSTR
jgi:lysylphosphatidylglycerol synthetase-like protein (DUF2156 family)